jgi:hypothetical protein
VKFNLSETLWVAALSGMTLLSSCQPKREDLALWELEQSRIELQERLNLLNYRLQVREGGDADLLADLQSTLAASLRRKQELLAERNTLTGEIASLETAAEELEQAWVLQQRGRAAGASFERWITLSGRQLENVKVVGIDDGGVSVRHEHGSATLRFDDLTSEQQIYFGLTASRAAAAENREQLASAAYERHVEQQLNLTKERESAAMPPASRGPETPALQASRTVAASTRVSPLSKPATPFGSRTWSGDSYRRRTSYYDTYYYYPSRQSCNSFQGAAKELLIKPTGPISIPNPYK